MKTINDGFFITLNEDFVLENKIRTYIEEGHIFNLFENTGLNITCADTGNTQIQMVLRCLKNYDGHMIDFKDNRINVILEKEDVPDVERICQLFRCKIEQKDDKSVLIYADENLTDVENVTWPEVSVRRLSDCFGYKHPWKEGLKLGDKTEWGRIVNITKYGHYEEGRVSKEIWKMLQT